MATLQELESALVKADAAGNVDDARALTRAIDQMRAAPAPAPAPAAAPASAPPPSQPAQSPIATPAMLSPTQVSTITGRQGPQGPATAADAGRRSREVLAQGARFGVPIAAGFATGGMGAIPAMAAMGAAGVAGEVGAQAIEGEGMRGGDIAASGIMAATPLVRLGNLTPFTPTVRAAARNTAVLAGRGAAQAGTTAVFEQAAELARDPSGYRAPRSAGEVWDRLTSPTALIGGGIGVVGGVAEGVARNARVAQAVRAGRGEQTGLLASELSEALVPLEARRIVSGDPRARAAMRDLYTDIDQTILQSYANAPDSNQIAAQIAPAVGRLKQLQDAARSADQAAQLAEAARQSAVGRAGVDMARIAEDATAKAAEAARTKALYELGIDRAFGPSRPTPTLAALSPSENTETLSQVIKTTFDAQKSALGRMWDEVGIGLNDPIMTKQGLIRRIEALSKNPKNALHGQDAKNAALAQIDALFPTPATPAPPAILGASGQPMRPAVGRQALLPITRERYLNFRDEVAAGLEANGMVRDRAEKLAGETYAAVRQAADDYINIAMPDKAAQWQKFNKTAAGWFEARDNAFIQDFVNPRTGELRQGKAKAFVDRLISGETEGFDALVKLGDSIAANADEASVAAAKLFKDNVASYISKGILDSAVTNRTLGAASDAAVFDSAKLYQTVNKLASRRYPVENLGLGSPKDLNALARMAGNGFVSKAEVDDFFRNVGALGGDAAAARIAYRREITKNLLGGGSKNVTENVRRQTELARRAKMDAATATAELNAAKQDPLVVLFGDGNFNFTGDLTSSDLGSAVGKLRTVEGAQVRRFMDAAQAKNPALAEQIRARTAADLFAQYSDVVPGRTPEANVAGIRNFFFNPSDEFAKQRRSVREIMGPKEYRNFQDLAVKIGGRARAESQLVRQIGQTVTKPDDALRGAIAAGSLAQGKAVTGTIMAANLGNVRKFLDNGQYSLLHLLYIRPDTARKFASASYNLDKFANQSGLHRVALQIAEREDQERQQASAEQAGR